MKPLENLKENLRPGAVYRRQDLEEFSKSVDRHLHLLVKQGELRKLAPGLYYRPETSTFGPVPPSDAELVRAFLKDDRFLLTSFNQYNSLGVGTTQLYNQQLVYNHKRHGQFTLGNRVFDFRLKHHFPRKPTVEFLLVDLVNNLDELAEDRETVLTKAGERAKRLDQKQLKRAVREYATVKTHRFFAEQVFSHAA